MNPDNIFTEVSQLDGLNQDPPLSESPAKETKAPVLKIPPNFEGKDEAIVFPTGIPVNFNPKRTTKGREEYRWSYPSMVEDTTKVPSDQAIASYALMLGPDRIKSIIEDELDQEAQYFWRLADGDWAKFQEYITTGKAQREIVDPARLVKEATKLHKEALTFKTSDPAKFKELITRSRELKQKATEILNREESYD